MARGKVPTGVRPPLDHLAHLDRTESRIDGFGDIESDHYYTLYPIMLPRPENGVEKATIVCGSCHQTVRCKVYSVSATYRIYRRTSAGNLAMLLAMVAAILTFNAIIFGWLRGPIAEHWILPVSILAAVGPVPALMRAFSGRRPDWTTGVRLLRSKGHSLRAAGSTHSRETMSMPNV